MEMSRSAFKRTEPVRDDRHVHFAQPKRIGTVKAREMDPAERKRVASTSNNNKVKQGRISEQVTELHASESKVCELYPKINEIRADIDRHAKSAMQLSLDYVDMNMERIETENEMVFLQNEIKTAKRNVKASVHSEESVACLKQIDEITNSVEICERAAKELTTRLEAANMYIAERNLEAVLELLPEFERLLALLAT